LRINDLFSVQGKRVLVTGGRRGLGFAMALSLAEYGAIVTVFAKSHDRGELPVGIVYDQVDLTDPVQRARSTESLLDNVGTIDILINNAGLQNRAYAADYATETLEADLNLMVVAAQDLSRRVSVGMIAQRWGRIINISSISAFQGSRFISGYVTAKHGLLGLTKALANEWGPYGVTVNGLAPGFIATDMSAHLFDDPKHLEELLGRIPAGRPGEADDLIGPLLLLASDAGAYINGHTLPVDGGWMAR
jgi:2-deoxy-D-gluconate 3-dehydrogenase